MISVDSRKLRMETICVEELVAELQGKRRLPVAEILAVIAAVIPLFKKKPFCLWHWQGPTPTSWKEYGPFSKRQCRKTMKQLVEMGCDSAHFAILRKGVKPPPYKEPTI